MISYRTMYAPNPGALDFAAEVKYSLLLNPLLMVGVFNTIWRRGGVQYNLAGGGGGGGGGGGVDE